MSNQSPYPQCITTKKTVPWTQITYILQYYKTFFWFQVRTERMSKREKKSQQEQDQHYKNYHF